MDMINFNGFKSFLFVITEQRVVLHGIVTISIVSFITANSLVREFTIFICFLYRKEDYINIPSKLLIGGLWKIPLVSWCLSDCFEFLIDLRWDLCLIHFIIQLFTDINSIHLLSLIFQLHKKEWVVIRLIRIEINFMRLIDFEIFVDVLANFFSFKILSMNSHILHYKEIYTVTGS